MSDAHSYYRYNGAVVCGGFLFTPRDEFNAVDDDDAATQLLASAKACANKHTMGLDFTKCCVAVERVNQGELFDETAHLPAQKSPAHIP